MNVESRAQVPNSTLVEPLTVSLQGGQARHILTMMEGPPYDRHNI
jgi:hypothetical protein